MRKHLRVSATFLLLSIIISLLVACSGNNTTGNDTSDGSDTSANSTLNGTTNTDSSSTSTNSDSSNVSSDASDTSDTSSSNSSSTEESSNVQSDTSKTESSTATESNKESNKESGTVNNDFSDPDGGFMILSNEAYTLKVVVPDDSSKAEELVYKKLREAIKSVTGVNVLYTSDLIEPGNTRSPDERAILVGNTNYEESQNINASTAYGEYGIQITDSKIVFSFSSQAEGEELITLFKKSINKNEDGDFWISRSFSVSKQKLLQLKDIPKFPANVNSLVDCNDSTAMVVTEKTTAEDFLNYCKTLDNSGFTLNASRDNVNGNYFRTYTKANLAYTVYFNQSTKAARIVAGPLDDIPTAEKDTTPEIYEPSVTFISQGERLDNGLGIIYLLPNGKFLIFDGGNATSTKISELLQKLAPNKNDITVAAWFISHPHGDHQQSIISVLRDRKNIKIESILYNYTTSLQYNSITTGSDGGGSAQNLHSSITRYVGEDTKIIKPHTGQIYKYGSVEVEILYTVEDMLPQTLDYLNSSSLVIRVKIGDHSLLILADTTHASGDIMRNMYGSHLQSEMVQLAHHGTYPGNASLYEAIKGKVLIWPSNYANVKKQITNLAVVNALKHATDVYVCNVDHITLNLPYTLVNNKEAFMAQTK